MTKILTAAYVEMSTLPQWETLSDCDVKLTFGDGMTLYDRTDVLSEIDRHVGEDFSELLAAIEALPESVLFAW